MQAKRLLVELPSTDVGFAQKAATELGLPDAVAKMNAVAKTGATPVGVLDWVSPAKNS